MFKSIILAAALAFAIPASAQQFTLVLDDYANAQPGHYDRYERERDYRFDRDYDRHRGHGYGQMKHYHGRMKHRHPGGDRAHYHDRHGRIIYSHRRHGFGR